MVNALKHAHWANLPVSPLLFFRLLPGSLLFTLSSCTLPWYSQISPITHQHHKAQVHSAQRFGLRSLFSRFVGKSNRQRENFYNLINKSVKERHLWPVSHCCVSCCVCVCYTGGTRENMQRLTPVYRYLLPREYKCNSCFWIRKKHL